MKIYYSGSGGADWVEETGDLINPAMLSFYYWNKGFGVKSELTTHLQRGHDMFMDSGAFSADSLNVSVDIDQYVAFCLNHQKQVTSFANLDDLRDPKRTWANQEIMESHGLSPVPVFHYGESPKWLSFYLDNYDHIGIGGMVRVRFNVLAHWLDNLFRSHVLDGKGKPRAMLHAFGVTSVPLLLRYPWHSADSTSWCRVAGFGKILVPYFRNGEPQWLTAPQLVSTSNDQLHSDIHFNHLSPIRREQIMVCLNRWGMTLDRLGVSHLARRETIIKYMKDLCVYKTKAGQTPFTKKRHVSFGL